MNKLEYLKMLQAVITRMAGNSFLIKGWCVTLVSAILALAAKEPNKLFIAVAIFPVLMFWILDGYFLYQERLFRSLYNAKVAIAENKDATLFSMDTSEYKTQKTWTSAVFSSTLNLFYIAMLISVIVIFGVALFWLPPAATTGK